MKSSAPLSARHSVTASVQMSSQIGQAEPDAVEVHRPWHRAGGEVPLLVENAVVRQIDLIAQRLHLAARKQRHGVVDFAVLAPGRAHDQGRGALFCDLREAVHRFHAGLHESGLQHEVLGRISRDEKLRKNQKIRALPRAPRPMRRAPAPRCRSGLRPSD